MASRAAQLDFIADGASSEARREGFPLDAVGVSAWLTAKGILPDEARLLTFCDLDPWHRSGAETYLCSFTATYSSESKVFTRRIVVKAIVSLGSARRLNDWQRRRELLRQNGIPVSGWYWAGEGVILEDYYPSDFKAVKASALLFGIARGLDKLGFRPVDYLRDVRCDVDGNPHYHDFGSDLGEPSTLPSKVAEGQFRAMFPQAEPTGTNTGEFRESKY